MSAYDAIIVGGGIQGATMALEVGRCGRGTVIVERNVAGSGTTASSFGIVHGGLRYLQHLDLARFFRSRREQAWFLSELAEFVQPMACVMPLYRGATRSPLLFRAAFLAERALSRDARAEPLGSLVDAASMVRAFPVPRQGLLAAAQWREAVLDDARAATAAIIERAGSACLSSTDATELIQHGGRVAGVRALVGTDRKTIELESRVVIVCAGAGTRALAGRFDRDYPQLSCATLGFNVRLDAPAPHGLAIAVSATPGRGRSLFLRESEGGLLAGTWYVPSQSGGPAKVAEADLETALSELRRALPGLDLARERVRAVPAGLLPDTDGTGRTLRTRDVVIDHGRTRGPRGLYSVLGTKLTTARALSERVARHIWSDARVARGKTAAAAISRASSG
jgi:glycerol-3-phosphate dehydrogenase